MVEVAFDEAAGVAFSIDPVRGDLGSVLINAAFGLGETVVGGEAEVDEYRVSRDESDVHDVRVGQKLHALVPDEIAGTRVVQLPASQADAPALDAAQRTEVARLAVCAEEHFGFPQDIEWAMRGGQLYLLQSRPVTRVAPRWTRDESAERFPTPLTPLTWDLVEAGFHASLNHSFALMGLPSFGDKWFAMRESYIYGNQTAVELYSGRFPAHLFRDIDSIRHALPEIARRYAWVQDLPVQWARDLDTYLIGIGRLSSAPLEGKDIADLWAHVLEINALGAAYFQPNIAISLTQRTLYAALQRLLGMVMPTEAAQVMFDRLLAQTDTKTGQVNAELWQLSRQLLRAGGLVEWLDEQPSSAGRMPDLRERFPSFAAELDAFLARHGHRELDFDAYHPTWVEAPHIVVDQLRLLARSDQHTQASPHQLRAAQAEAEGALLNGMPPELRFFVQEVIRLARVYTALDDLEHYQTTRLTLPLRRGLRALGDAMVRAGALHAADDVYFLHVDVLGAAIRDASPEACAELRALAQKGRADYSAATRVNPSWVYGEDDASEPGGADLCGTAGSPGRVDAEVFVVNGPEDFSRFPPGAILVARTTNPAWTALFYQSAGVITESGGALSHGAVTARELGLPAVMNIRNVTRRLENGQRVRVDGTKGVVTLIEA